MSEVLSMALWTLYFPQPTRLNTNSSFLTQYLHCLLCEVFFCDLVHSFHRWLSPCASNYTMNSCLFNGTIVLQICLSHSLNVLEDGDHAFSVFTSGALRSAWFIGRFSTYIWWINHIPWSVGFTHQRTPRREHVKNHGNAPSKIWTLPRDCMHGLFLASSF